MSPGFSARICGCGPVKETTFEVLVVCTCRPGAALMKRGATSTEPGPRVGAIETVAVTVVASTTVTPAGGRRATTRFTSAVAPSTSTGSVPIVVTLFSTSSVPWIVTLGGSEPTPTTWEPGAGLPCVCTPT